MQEVDAIGRSRGYLSSEQGEREGEFHPALPLERTTENLTKTIQRAKRALRGRRRSSVGARAVQLLLRCPHTPRLHRPSRMLASALPVEGATQDPVKRCLRKRWIVQGTFVQL
ncbi:MAG: hypothetical protein AABZ05_02425 [Nitrospirota bacterium]